MATRASDIQSSCIGGCVRQLYFGDGTYSIGPCLAKSHVYCHYIMEYLTVCDAVVSIMVKRVPCRASVYVTFNGTHGRSQLTFSTFDHWTRIYYSRKLCTLRSCRPYES
jgi:hypothetical protein